METHKNKVLIYGISGQDGSYLAKKYLEKKFIVHGISRKKGKWDKNLKYLDIKNKIKVFKINKNFNNLHSILKNYYKYNYNQYNCRNFVIYSEKF